MSFFHIGLVCFDCFNRMLKKQNEPTHLVIPTSDMMRLREKIGAKILGLLAKTTHNYAEMKQIVIADLVSFNKKRDREVSGVTRKDMILQRSLVLQRAQTTDYELFKLTEVEMMFAKYYTLLRLPGKSGKFVPVLIPPKTLEVIDIMINDDKLKSDNYFSKQREANNSTEASMFWGNTLKSLSCKTKKCSDLQSSASILPLQPSSWIYNKTKEFGWPTSWDTTWMFTTSTTGCTLML